jgi:hypothetical protein
LIAILELIFMEENMETYSEEQVDQILRYALAKRTNGQNLTKQQIYEIASDMGVSEADFLASVQEWQSTQAVRKEQLEFDKYKKKSLQANVLKYAIVNSFYIWPNRLGNLSSIVLGIGHCTRFMGYLPIRKRRVRQTISKMAT